MLVNKLLINAIIEENIPLLSKFDTKLFDGSVLHLAVLHNKPISIKFILSKGVDINSIDSIGRTVLYLSLELKRSYENIKFLLDCGADPNVYDDYGNYMLYDAVNNQMDVKIIKLLLDYDAYPLYQDDYGKTLFDYIDEIKDVKYKSSVVALFE